MKNRYYPVFRLKELRARYDLNQADLAKKLGVSRTTVSNIERGATAPSPRVLIALRKLLGDELFLPPTFNEIKPAGDGPAGDGAKG